MKIKPKKRKIRQNIYGNWNGYEGRRRVKEFGLDKIEAEIWVGIRNADASIK